MAAWEPCSGGTLPGLSCERLVVPGYTPEWTSYAAIGVDTTHAGAPLVALEYAYDYYGPKRRTHVLWVRLSDLAIVAKLTGDEAAGGCFPDAPRVAPGVLVASVSRSTGAVAGKDGMRSGFVALTDSGGGKPTILASAPFHGQSQYIATSDGIYGQLANETSSGMYRANGADPQGTPVVAPGYSRAFPLGALGPDFLVDLQDAGYVGVGLFRPTVGFQPIIPPSRATDQGGFNLGGDGAQLVWTQLRQQTGPYQFAVRDVVTAPYATSPEAIASTTRRLTAARGGSTSHPWAVGCGLASQRWELETQVVRLVDGASWVYGGTDAALPVTPGAITCDHIYGTMDDGSVVRVRLDSVGPFVPP